MDSQNAKDQSSKLTFALLDFHRGPPWRAKI